MPHVTLACTLLAAMLSQPNPDPAPPIARDPARNIHIPAPQELVKVLRVGAVFDGERFQIRYEFPTDRPSWYHAYRVYESGQWRNLQESPVGPEPQGLYEDRISMAIDRGRVEGFGQYGGFILARPGVASRTDEVPPEVAEQHPYFRDVIGTDEVLKFTPQSRNAQSMLDVHPELWSRVRTEEDLEQLRREGAFIDTWQWRAHRSNPIGYGDNGYVLEYRHSSDGRGMYTGNWDDEENRPAWMFDVEKTGVHALRRDRLLAREYSQDDPYYLSEETALPFDPEREWQDGDVLPAAILRTPEGSRGALQARGRYQDGSWRVRVTRTLESPNPLDSHTLEPGRAYNVQFAVHTGAQGERWHYVSMPLTLGLGPDAIISARELDDEEILDDAQVEWTELPIIYPGQATIADLIEGPDWLREAFALALQNPTDQDAVTRLAHMLARHEMETVVNQAAPARQGP